MSEVKLGLDQFVEATRSASNFDLSTLTCALMAELANRGLIPGSLGEAITIGVAAGVGSGESLETVQAELKHLADTAPEFMQEDLHGLGENPPER